MLKPAELTPIIGGQVLAEAAHAAGLPPGVFNVVEGDGPAAGHALAEHRGLDLLDFTGSREVGTAIALSAARDLRPVRLELGGSNAFVVLDDADVELAASCALIASLEFQGQTCISASRHIVLESVADAYVAALTRKVAALKVGNPFDPDTDLGPLISEGQRDRVHQRIVAPSDREGGRRRDRRDLRRAVLPADGAHRRHPGHAGLRRGGVRAGASRHGRETPPKRRSSWSTAIRC